MTEPKKRECSFMINLKNYAKSVEDYESENDW